MRSCESISRASTRSASEPAATNRPPRRAASVRPEPSKNPGPIRVTATRVACDGATDIAAGAALGHPRVWLEIDPEIGHVDCGYCDRRFVLAGGPADTRSAEAA